MHEKNIGTTRKLSMERIPLSNKARSLVKFAISYFHRRSLIGRGAGVASKHLKRDFSPMLLEIFTIFTY